MPDDRGPPPGTTAWGDRLDPRVATFFDELIPRQLDENRAFGATVAVVAGDRVIHARGVHGAAHSSRSATPMAPVARS